jgi:hypothetical protein
VAPEIGPHWNRLLVLRRRIHAYELSGYASVRRFRLPAPLLVGSVIGLGDPFWF